MERTGNEANHWQSGLNSIARQMMNRPAMAAAARARAQQMILNQQRGELYKSQTGEHAVRTQKLAEELRGLKLTNDQREKMIPLSQAASAAVQAGKMDDPAIAAWRGTLADIVAANKGNPAIQALAAVGITSPDAELKAGTNLEVADKNAASRLAVAGQNNAAKEKIAQGSLADKMALEKLKQQGKQGNYDQEVETIPAVPEAIPAQPAKTHWFSPDEPAKPAIPAHGEIKRTRRIPHESAWSNTNNLPAPKAAPIPKSTGINVGAHPEAAAAPAAQAQEAPAQSAAQSVVPPIGERKIGHVATTPKGTFVWDGATWQPTQSQSAQ